jgi:hypothetical protein
MRTTTSPAAALKVSAPAKTANPINRLKNTIHTPFSLYLQPTQQHAHHQALLRSTQFPKKVVLP